MVIKSLPGRTNLRGFWSKITDAVADLVTLEALVKKMKSTILFLCHCLAMIIRLQVIYTHYLHYYWCCIFSAIVVQFSFYMFVCDSLSCNISILQQASGIVQLRHVRTELHVLMVLLVAAANANLDSLVATARQVVTLVFVTKSAMSNFTTNSHALNWCWMYFNLQFTNNSY